MKNTHFGLKDIVISPNPTTGLINLSFGNLIKNEADLAIYNVQRGGEVYAKTNFKAESANIELSDYQEGLYVAILNVDGKIYATEINLEK